MKNTRVFDSRVFDSKLFLMLLAISAAGFGSAGSTGIAGGWGRPGPDRRGGQSGHHCFSRDVCPMPGVGIHPGGCGAGETTGIRKPRTGS